MEESIHVIFDGEVMEGNLVKDIWKSLLHFEDEFTFTKRTPGDEHDETPINLPQDPQEP